jgi:hypothetical protein
MPLLDFTTWWDVSTHLPTHNQQHSPLCRNTLLLETLTAVVTCICRLRVPYHTEGCIFDWSAGEQTAAATHPRWYTS